MKILTILLTLTFTVMFSSPSFAEWKKVIADEEGNTLYLDFETIRKRDNKDYQGRTAGRIH